MRLNNRKNDELRPLTFIKDFTDYAEGCVLVKMGQTHVLCTASIEDTPPKWLQGTGQGWLTAEYGMLPRSTHSRIKRERGQSGGRTHEISRMVARSLRAALDLKALGERQIYLDCDVLQADGGTRTAAINGGFLALAFAVQWGEQQGLFLKNPLLNQIAAISLGVLSDKVLLDLDYEEDSQIDTDMNIAMNDKGHFVELQGTAEKSSFSRDHLQSMVELAQKACHDIFLAQKNTLNS